MTMISNSYVRRLGSDTAQVQKVVELAQRKQIPESIKEPLELSGNGHYFHGFDPPCKRVAKWTI